MDTPPIPSRSAAALPTHKRRMAAALVALVVGALGLTITAIAAHAQFRSEEAKAIQRFERYRARLKNEVQRRLREPVYGLQQLRAAFAASPTPERLGARAWEAMQAHAQDFVGVLDFGFAARVARPKAEEASYTVRYLTPTNTHRLPQGSNLTSVPAYQSAIELAIAADEPTLSAPQFWVQDGMRQAQMLYVLPVYPTPSESANKRANVAPIGVVFAVLSVHELLRNATGALNEHFSFQLIDSASNGAGHTVFATDGDRLDARAPMWQAQSLLSAGGRDFTLLARSTPELEAFANDPHMPPLIGLGAGASVLLAWLLWLLLTGRARAEERAHHTNAELERLATIVRHTSNAVMVTDAQLRIHWVNEGFTRLYGYSLPEVLGKTPGEVLGSSKTTAHALSQLEFSARTGTSVVVELINRSSTGKELHIQSDVQPLHSPDGTLEGFIEISTDITGMVQATEAAEQSARSKGQFLANMSHEIRTPMNAILGMLKLLKNTDLTHQQQDYVHKTDGAARSLLGLLNDILDFSKVEEGKMSLDPISFRLDRLMRDLAVIYAANLGTKPVEVLFDIQPGIPEVLVGDVLRLQQVLINLGGNAIKFTHAGQVVVAVRLMAKTATDATLRFSVQDSGIGIAEEHQHHIFEGFSQAEASTTRRFGGTGLGLAISKRLVAIMGGDLTLHSALGEGSTFAFHVTLPIATDIPDDLREPPRPSVPPQRVLVVDDNRVAGEIMLGMVRSWGWTAEYAPSGENALQRLRATPASEGIPFEVIYVDWHMPPCMDGWDLARDIRALAAERGVNPPKIIMVTAHGRETLVQRTQEEQDRLDGFLVKPVTASMLQDAVMEQKHSQARLRKMPRNGGPQRRLRGMRLLVVEDNQINQQVAEELLASEGALVALAANGQLGVEAVAAAQPQFDAVLMDLQMPILDGFAATRAIRLQLGLRDLPIIAMTANAMASDREACLAVGMNEHVGKPFDMTQLVGVLLRLTQFTPTTEPTALPAPDSPTANPTPTAPHSPTHPQVNFSAAIARMSGLQTLYVRLANDFVQLLAHIPHTLTTAIAHHAHSEVTRTLHTLKGNAATLGVDALAAFAGRLERQSLSAGGLDSVSQVLPELTEEIQRSSQALQAVVEQLSPAEPTANSQAPSQSTPSTPPLSEATGPQLHTSLRALARLLDASDMDALAHFAALRPQLHHLPPESLEPLEHALQELDLEAAAQACHALLKNA